MTPRNDIDTTDVNRDPLTGAPGAHPVGTGIGAAGGGAAGAAIGAAASGPAAPIGAVVGAVVGAVAGGLAGKGAAEAINPTAENEFWERNYATREYVEPGTPYEEYRPAYQYGWESKTRYSGKEFEEVEPDLARDWHRERRPTRLSWEHARHAARDAWDRVTHRERH